MGSNHVDHGALERLLIYGEITTDEHGRTTRAWPSYRDLAERFGMPSSTVGFFAQRNDTMRRREQFQRSLADEEAALDRTARVQGEGVIWARVDHLLVHGETSQDDNDNVVHRYPTTEELAQRFDLETQDVFLWAQDHHCFDRREAARAALARTFSEQADAFVSTAKHRLQLRVLQTTALMVDRVYERLAADSLEWKANHAVKALQHATKILGQDFAALGQAGDDFDQVMARLEKMVQDRNAGGADSPEARGERLYLAGQGQQGHPPLAETPPDDADPIN